MGKKALFIHGFHSDCDSTTGGRVAEILKDYGYETIHPTFDLLDCKTSLTQMNQILKDEDISLVAAHSLGGFYGFILPFDSKKILINPCLKPEIEIPKLMLEGEVFPEEIKPQWIEARESANSRTSEKKNLYGIFGKKDELFSYADYAKNELGFEGCIQMMEGGHKPLREDLQPALEKVLKLLGESVQAD